MSANKWTNTWIYYTMHYALCTMHYALYTIHYTLYTIHYTLYTTHYTLYTIHYMLYTILFAGAPWPADPGCSARLARGAPGGMYVCMYVCCKDLDLSWFQFDFSLMSSCTVVELSCTAVVPPGDAYGYSDMLIIIITTILLDSIQLSWFCYYHSLSLSISLSLYIYIYTYMYML